MHDGHDHAHGSAHGEANETDKTKLLLRFTLDHNTQHVAEAKALAEKLETESRADAALLLRESIALYEAGNEKIHAALHKL
jgi:hypothetical protein